MDAKAIDHHLELLHTYHLDLWAEIEAQLHVLRASQQEIQKLRDTRIKGESQGAAFFAAQVLARHVQVLKGRTSTLNSTVAELEASVNALLELLSESDIPRTS
jgi:hypothetical protein